MNNLTKLRNAAKHIQGTASPTYAASVAATNQRKQNIQKLSDAIRDTRVNKGWTQRDLAIKSGYSQGTITRAEHGGEISLPCLLAIVDALGKKIELT